MDLKRDKVTALAFAHFVWILAAALPYLSTPGTASITCTPSAMRLAT